MIYTIYKHTCTITNKAYIGYTQFAMQARWSQHLSNAKYGSHYHIYKAIRKYGPDCWTHEILETDIPTQELAREREKYWIAFYDTMQNGYNETAGGEGCSGTPEVRKKMGDAKRGKPVPQETKDKMSATLKKNMTPERREKISKNTKAALNTPEMHQKLSDANKRKSPESLARLGKLVSKKVQQFDFDGNLIATYDSIAEAVRQTGTNGNSICKCCKGKRNHAKHFIWRYL